MSSRFDWEREVKASDLPRSCKLVLLTFATHTNKGGKAWPSQETLARETGLSDRSVRGHLATAMKAGWLERTRKGGHVGRRPGVSVSSEYVIRIPGQRKPTSGSQTLGSGSDVPVPTWQPEDNAWQPEDNDLATGSQLPPIIREHSKNQSLHADLQRESEPFESASGGDSEEEEKPPHRVPDLQLFEKAKKLGKQLGSLTDDLGVVEDQFNADRILSRFPELMHTTRTNWRTERIRLGLAAPERIVH